MWILRNQKYVRWGQVLCSSFVTKVTRVLSREDRIEQSSADTCARNRKYPDSGLLSVSAEL